MDAYRVTYANREQDVLKFIDDTEAAFQADETGHNEPPFRIVKSVNIRTGSTIYEA